MARSMNGINNIEVNNIEFPDGSTISSASNLVQLDTNNNFTGNNTYNTNLPTSDVNPDLVNINNNTMLNRFSADKLYSTDANNFITAFSRDGTTGTITLTQSDTGDPITSKSYTSITDDEITAIGTNAGAISTLSTTVGNNATAIGTNTTAISNLSSALDPCFKSASLNGQDLTLTPVDTTALPTVITIPGGSGTGDAVLSDGTSTNPQTFTQFNKFNQVVNAPAVPTSNEHLTNKTYVDSKILKTEFGQIFANTPVISYTVQVGNPNLAFNAQGNNKGGRMDDLKADIEVPTGSSGKVRVDYQIIGEWNRVAQDKGVILGRATQQANGTFIYDKLIRADDDPSYSITRLLAGFLIPYHNDASTTMEQSSGFIIDDTATAGYTYRYTPILVNADSYNNLSATFKLNRTNTNVSQLYSERAVSVISAVLINV